MNGFHHFIMVTAGGMFTALQTSLRGIGVEAPLCLMAQPCAAAEWSAFCACRLVLYMMIQSHQASIHQLSTQRKCQSCSCRYISTVCYPALEASSPLPTALKSCRTRDFILLRGKGNTRSGKEMLV